MTPKEIREWAAILTASVQLRPLDSTAGEVIESAARALELAQTELAGSRRIVEELKGELGAAEAKIAAINVPEFMDKGLQAIGERLSTQAARIKELEGALRALLGWADSVKGRVGVKMSDANTGAMDIARAALSQSTGKEGGA